MKLFRHRWMLGLAVVLASQSALAVLNDKQIDQITHKVMNHFQVPGVAVGVIYKGKVVHAKGYGLKRIGYTGKVDTHTLFKIASNTKAFTTAALSILVDEGKLHWDDKVVDYLPDFKLHDPWVTAHFTVTDLLTHRSGLGLGAGDLMLWPEPSSFSRNDVIHNLRYLKPDGEFRANYAYDNLMYIVAGQLIPAITGQRWEDFVEQHIMQPLGMNHCVAGKIPARLANDVATPHGIVEGKLQAIIRHQPDKPLVSAAAGGIQCSLADMLTWAQVQLNGGRYGQDKRLFSEAQHEMMWTAQTIMPLHQSEKINNNSHISAYGLGWRLNDMNGYWRVHHTGSLAGMYSYVSLIPDLKLGIVILMNQQSSAAREALMYSILKPYLHAPKKNWIAEFDHHSKSTGIQTLANPATQVNQQAIATLDISQYAGDYQDPWLGHFYLSMQGNKLRVRSQRIVKFVGSMTPLDHDKFLIRWDDRSLDADAIAVFERDAQGNINAMKLQPASPDIDFSYDFRDLDFTRLTTNKP